MSCFRAFNDYENNGKPKRMRKVTSFHRHIKPVTGIHSSNIGDNVSTKKHHVRATSSESKLPEWHFSLEQAFENFLQALDEIYITLRKKDSKHPQHFKNLRTYQDICLHLRMEVLIALDKLELLCVPSNEDLNEKSEFFNKMNDLKSQLSQLRWLYHNAIKDLDPQIA